MFNIFLATALLLQSSFILSYFTEIENCKITTHGREYVGYTNVSKNGRPCLPWKKEYLNEIIMDDSIYFDTTSIIETNYCRNPTNFPNGPWCIVDESILEWEHCHIRSCIKERNWCKDTDKGTEYLGDLNFTKTGKICKPWIIQSNYSENSFPEKSFQLVGNKCRNPDMSAGPWCFYSDDYKREVCEVPRCDEKFSQIEYFGGYDFLKTISSLITTITLTDIYQTVTVTVTFNLESLNSDILRKTSLWATDYNPKCQTDLDEYEYCTIVESKNTTKSYIISYSCFRPMKYLIFICPIDKSEYTIKYLGTFYNFNLSPSKQFDDYEIKMNEYFQKKIKQDVIVPSDSNHGHFYLLNDNVIPYALSVKNKVTVTISSIGKGRISFLATEKLVNPEFYPELQDLFQEVYEKPVENPKLLTKKYFKALIDENKLQTAMFEHFIWNAHDTLGRDLVFILLQLIKSGLRIIIGVKPWAYYYYQAQFLDSELKVLFETAGIWPSKDSDSDVWRTVTKFSTNTMPFYYRLEYAKKNLMSLKNLSKSIGNFLAEVPFHKIMSKRTFELLKSSIVNLYSNYLPYIKHLIPCSKGSITKESDQDLIKLFNYILISFFGKTLIAPGLSFYPGTFQSSDILLENFQMQLNLKYKDEVSQLGLYVVPGKHVSVQITESNSQSCRIFINFHLFNTINKEKLFKWPITKTEIIIKRNILETFAYPFGGLLSISCDANNDKVKITFINVVKVPVFDRRDKKDTKDWIQQQSVVSPWAVVSSDTLVFVLSSNAIRNLADPETFMRMYDSMVKEEFHLKGRSISTSYREIISTDIQITAGYMHAGYPIGTQIFWVTNPYNKKDYFFDKYNIEIDGEWGLMHELGHNLQEPIFTFNGAGEVNNNIFTLVAIESMTNMSSWSPNDGWVSTKVKIKDLVKYLNNGTFEEWKKTYYVALSIYAQLRNSFGWEFYSQVFRRYNELKNEIGSISDNEKIQLWIKTTSEISGMNLCPLYELWRWPISQKTEKELSKLQMFLPDDFLTKMIEKRVDEIISKFGGIDSVFRTPLTIPEKIGPLKHKFSIEGTKVIQEIIILD